MRSGVLAEIDKFCHKVYYHFMATINISLPAKLVRLVDRETEKSGFSSRSELVRDLLRKHLFEKGEFKVFKKRGIDEIKLELARTGKYSQVFIESVTKGLSKSSLYEN